MTDQRTLKTKEIEMISRKDNLNNMELTIDKIVDLAWLAGFIDGEGSFSLVYRFIVGLAY